MHMLGTGQDSVRTIFACLGLAPGKGCHDKWKRLEDSMGDAEQQVSGKICAQNQSKCVAAYQDKAKLQYTEW